MKRKYPRPGRGPDLPPRRGPGALQTHECLGEKCLECLIRLRRSKMPKVGVARSVLNFRHFWHFWHFRHFDATKYGRANNSDLA
jgi:hypothetical protein